MAGIYVHVYIRETDKRLMGQSHGCGCCSYTESLSKVALQEHIDQLKEDLQQAESLLKVYFGLPIE